MVSAVSSPNLHPREEREIPGASLPVALSESDFVSHVRCVAANLVRIESGISIVRADLVEGARTANAALHHEAYRYSSEMSFTATGGMHRNAAAPFVIETMGPGPFFKMLKESETARREGRSFEPLANPQSDPNFLAFLRDGPTVTANGSAVRSKQESKEITIHNVVFPQHEVFLWMRSPIFDRFLKHYEPDAAHGCFRLKSPDVVRSNPRLAEELEAIIGILAERDSSALLQHIETRGGRRRPRLPPLVAGRDLTIINGGSTLHAQNIDALFTPFGALRADRGCMLQAQGEVVHGGVASASVTITGRLQPGLLEWLRGNGVGALGPVPDVLVIYKLPLPSGTSYNFSLHKPRQNKVELGNDPSKLTDADREIISGLERYLHAPENRQRLGIFTELRESDYDPRCFKLLSSPTPVSFGIRLAGDAAKQWVQSVWTQLREHARENVPIAENRLALDSYESFCDLARGELLRIPATQKYREAEFFTLNAAESVLFAERYLPKLYRVIQDEHKRAVEEGHETKAARQALGYRGPDAGIALPLNYMLMDMIYDLRKEQKFRELRARDHGMDPSEVDIPSRIGRKYDGSKASLSVDQLPQFLDALPSQRYVALTIEKKDTREAIVTTPEGLPKLYQQLVAASLEAIKSDIETARAELDKPGYWATMSKAQRFDAQLFFSYYDNLSEERAKLEGERDGLREERAVTMKALAARRAKGEVSKDDLVAANGSFSEREHAIDKEEFRLERRLYQLCRSRFADEIQEKGHAIGMILDEEIVRFIFSIDHSGKPAYAFDPIEKHDGSRSTHPELIGGRNLYAGGEQIVGRHREAFGSFEGWEKFQAEITKEDARHSWKLLSLRGSSGHYQPGIETLTYGANVVLPLFQAAGFDISECEVLDHLVGGAFVHQLAPFA